MAKPRKGGAHPQEDGELAEENHFVMLTTEPNGLVGRYHDRMAAVLEPEHWTAWLDRDSTEDDLREMLRPFGAEKMRAHRVTTKMSNSRYKGADSAEEIPDEPRQQDFLEEAFK